MNGALTRSSAHLEAADGDNVACARDINVGAVVGVHLQQAPDALLGALGAAEGGAALLQRATARVVQSD